MTPIQKTNISGWEITIYQKEGGYLARASCQDNLFATTLYPTLSDLLTVVEQRIRYWKWQTEQNKAFNSQFARSVCPTAL